MTTYTTIPDADIDQDSPVTQPLLTALRDNPIAIAEGAPGAPVIQSVPLNAARNVSAGPNYVIENNSEHASGPTTSYVTAKQILRFYQEGTLRVYFEHKQLNNSIFSSVARVVIDGIEVASWSTQSSSYVARQVDVNVSFGSTIQIQHRMTTTSQGESSYVRNAKLGDNDAGDGLNSIWPFAYNSWIAP